MYALIISTNQRNKEPKKDQEKTKKQIQRNKTKPGAKNHKTRNKKSQKEDSLEVLSWEGCYVLSSCGSGLLRVSSFIVGSLRMEGLCVTWLLPVGVGESEGNFAYKLSCMCSMRKKPLYMFVRKMLYCAASWKVPYIKHVRWHS